jgi:hypothetical protein
MGHRKTPNILISLLLLLGVFTNSALAEVCFCGQACVHGLQPTTKIKANFLFHMRCSGTSCKSCQLEKGQTVKAANSRHQPLNVKILDNAFIVSPLLDYPSTHHILKNFCSFYDRGAIASPPIYLQNLSILC